MIKHLVSLSSYVLSACEEGTRRCGRRASRVGRGPAVSGEAASNHGGKVTHRADSAYLNGHFVARRKHLSATTNKVPGQRFRRPFVVLASAAAAYPEHSRKTHVSQVVAPPSMLLYKQSHARFSPKRTHQVWRAALRRRATLPNPEASRRRRRRRQGIRHCPGYHVSTLWSALQQ